MNKIKMFSAVICVAIFLVGCAGLKEMESEKSDYEMELEQIEEKLNRFVEQSNAVYLDQFDYNYTIELQDISEDKKIVITEQISDIYKKDDEIKAVILNNQIRYELDCTLVYSELKDITMSEDYYWDYDNYAYLIEIESFNPKNMVLRSEGVFYSEDDYSVYSDLGQLVIVEGKILEIEKLVK